MSLLLQQWFKNHSMMLGAHHRAMVRFQTEGPFVFAEDDEDAKWLGAAGKRVTYIDSDSIMLEDVK